MKQIHAATFITAGLALVLSWLLAMLACYLGFSFGGLDADTNVFYATCLCVIVVAVTERVLKHRLKPFTWRMRLIEVMLLALVSVSFLSWSGTRQQLKIFMNPAPVPGGIHFYRGRSILFNSYVHFSAPSAIITTLIHSKGLVEVPADLSDNGDFSGFAARERTKIPQDWWQPVSMPHARFFFRGHENEDKAAQGWSEGRWVNGATNEVYAFISG